MQYLGKKLPNYGRGDFILFALLLLAQAFSLTGGYIQTLVLSWVAADTAGGLYALSFYMIACYLPVALLAYPFGRWLDGRSQKKWLLLSEGLLAGLSLLLWQMAKRELVSFPFLLIFGGIWGVVRAFQTPLYQSLPKKLSENLSKGTALLTAITCAARGLGPILGGLLYGRYGAPLPFLINFLSFLPSLLLLSFIKIPKNAAGRKPALKKHLPLLGKIFLVGFFGINYNVTFVALVREKGFESGAYGIALGLLGLGALLGLFIKSKFAKPLPLGLFPLLMGILNLCLSVGERLLWIGICILLYGILDFWFFSQSIFLLTNDIKKEETTAIMGLYTMVSVGAVPAGALFWSFIAKTFGLSSTLGLIGAGLMLTGSLLLIPPKKKRL